MTIILLNKHQSINLNKILQGHREAFLFDHLHSNIYMLDVVNYI